MQNVQFYFGTQAKFDALTEYNELALYFITDTQRLYKGSKLFATGAMATTMVDGLMSKEDKVALDELIASQGTSTLTPVDGTITIVDNKIGVAISAQKGNALQKIEDGLFVPSTQEVSIPEYSIEKQVVADEGFNATYKLKKTLNGVDSYVGDSINFSIDAVLETAEFKIVSIEGQPYESAKVGDPYLDLGFNTSDKNHVYVPLKGLVDTYVAGNGIKIENNVVSINIAVDSHGLTAVNGEMAMLLATSEQDGAMSKEDKVFIDSIPTTYASKAEMNAITQRVKYEVFSKPAGTITKIMDNEIRICCLDNTVWTQQAVGPTGNPDRFYIGLKVYAPVGADHFMEDLKKTIEDETVFNFTDDFSGRDSYGNGYSLVWLPVAAKQEDGSWKYYGDNSTTDKMIGWYYTSAFYDASNNLLSKETIRINLVNENMGTEVIPYYMNNYVTDTELESAISDVSATMLWTEM